MNMPEMDKYYTVQAHTILRQYLDYKHWYDRQKLTLRDIHNCQYVACMNPTAGNFTIDSRIQRHFAVFAVSFPGNVRARSPEIPSASSSSFAGLIANDLQQYPLATFVHGASRAVHARRSAVHTAVGRRCTGRASARGRRFPTYSDQVPLHLQPARSLQYLPGETHLRVPLFALRIRLCS